MHVMSPVQQASLEYGKAYIQQIEILHYIDFVRKKDDLNNVQGSRFFIICHIHNVVQVVALLYSGTTSLWSASMCYIILL